MTARLQRISSELLAAGPCSAAAAATLGVGVVEEGWRVVKEGEFTSFMEAPDHRRETGGAQGGIKAVNVTHDTEGGKEYGYRAALVPGPVTYCWAVPTIRQALGDVWLDDGWSDVEFRRPVYPEEKLRIQVLAPTDPREEAKVGGPGVFKLEVCKEGPDGLLERCVAGTVGLGKAPFFSELKAPQDRAAKPPTEHRVDPEKGPTPEEVLPLVGKDMLPRGNHISEKVMRRFAAGDIGIPASDPLWGDGVRPRLHPSLMVLQCTPLFIHNVGGYKAGINVRIQVQHLGKGLTGQQITNAGHVVEAYERKGHQYIVFDNCLRTEDSSADFARIRYHLIYQPAKRGGAGGR